MNLNAPDYPMDEICYRCDGSNVQTRYRKGFKLHICNDCKTEWRTPT